MSIKVTDRRMFTEDGELREGFDETESDEEEPKPQQQGTVLNPQRSAEPSSPPQNSGPTPDLAGKPKGGASAPPPRPEVDTGEERHAAAQFIEIIASLVEPATLFLGDAQMPDGQEVEDLERARVYIDLLAVLQEKTRGNLTQEEDSVLGEMLYRLRMRYVQKRDAKR